MTRTLHLASQLLALHPERWLLISSHSENLCRWSSQESWDDTIQDAVWQDGDPSEDYSLTWHTTSKSDQLLVFQGS